MLFIPKYKNKFPPSAYLLANNILSHSSVYLSSKVCTSFLTANYRTLVRQLSNACFTAILQAFDSCETSYGYRPLS